MTLARFFRKYRWSLLGTVLLSSACAVVTMLLLAQLNGLATGGVAVGDKRLVAIGVFWLVALLLTGAASQYLLSTLGSNLVSQLRTDLSAMFIAMDYEKLADRKHSAFGSLIEDVANIAPLVLIAPLLGYNVLLMGLYLVYLATISIPLLAVLCVFVAATVVVSVVLERETRGQFDDLRQSDEKLFEHFRAIAEGKKEMCLNAHRAEHFSEVVLEPAIQRSRHFMVRVYMGWGLNEAWTTFINYGSVLLIIYVGYAYFALASQTIIQFVIASLFLNAPLNYIVGTGKQVGLGAASLRHLQHVGLDLRANPSSVNSAAARGETKQEYEWRSIRLDATTYNYPGEAEKSFAFGPVDLRFERGEMVFIVGGNGSGKSTLLLLLCSLLTPVSGRVLMDDEPVNPHLSAYRKYFGGVFGDSFLFPHVLGPNGKAMDDALVDELLVMLELDASVRVHESKLSRLTLSTGQRKRLALLQCYAEDRDICFFDEWAADQDTHFRAYFYDRLLPDFKRQGKTVIAISHDDRYFHVADRVITLDAGRVVTDTRPPQKANG